MNQGIFLRVKNPEIWFEFKSFVCYKYGKIYGVLGEELTRALQLYLAVQRGEVVVQPAQGGKRTHTFSQKNNEKSRTIKTMEKIANEIKKEYQNEVPQRIVEQIITEVAGSRVVDKYLNLLTNYGFLQPDRVASNGQVIFKVM